MVTLQFYEPQWAHVPCVRVWLVELVVGLSEALDPDFDCLTAATAYSLLSPAEDAAFAKSWQEVHLIGNFIAKVGLAHMLLFSLVSAVLVQLATLADTVWNAWHNLKSWNRSLPLHYDRALLVGNIGHIAEIGGLMMLGSMGLKLRKAENPDHPGDHIRALFSKVVCETLMASWFQISFLALSLHRMTESQLIGTGFSISTSLFVMLRALSVAVPHFIYQLRATFQWGLHRWIFLNGACIAMTFGCLVASVVRLWGISMCQSHIINITSGCVSV